MAYTPILNNPIEWDDKEPNKCKEPFCGAYLDMNDYEDTCNTCYNKEEPEEEEEKKNILLYSYLNKTK